MKTVAGCWFLVVGSEDQDRRLPACFSPATNNQEPTTNTCSQALVAGSWLLAAKIRTVGCLAALAPLPTTRNQQPTPALKLWLLVPGCWQPRSGPSAAWLLLPRCQQPGTNNQHLLSSFGRWFLVVGSKKSAVRVAAFAAAASNHQPTTNTCSQAIDSANDSVTMTTLCMPGRRLGCLMRR